MSGDRLAEKLAFIEQMANECVLDLVEEDDVLALVEIAKAARPLFTLAAAAHEGDPWYAEHEGLDAEAILRDARAALARLDSGATEEGA